ncbi:DNA primase [Klugiella xanthotipulae]|uniref:DNA primase n=1 Tax=Klugiella xanthotipulae TaxID=244735 RepID=A0A543HSN6_9MICO|nr:DNA primase [Klugiella xanthotipulae]TQM61274.1 DNA primase [Klugiella xanthotipulae]
MAGLIRQSDIEEVKSRINLADIVSDHVALKPAGVGSLKGLCPFHDERSPSFHVRPALGYYHCFGCGESGDAITFLQRMDHVTFTEAVERLAGSVGYQLHYEEGSEAGDGINRARLLRANQAAAEFFAEQLGLPEAAIGRAFLGERGFDAASAQLFGVGFAPKSWDALLKYLRSRGFTEQEIVGAGLVSQGDRGVYDRFRGRLMWPIRDTSGQVLGFGARRLLEDDKGPKYLNTPETAVYRKSQVLYGLDLAKRDISRSHRVVVVEGYTDVMACHMAGVTTAVATCGTAFGVEHIKVIRRIMGDDTGQGEVIFTFDPDAAGQKAALRAFSEEKRFSAQTFVAVAPEGLDPCDLRLAHGNEAVVALMDQKKPMFEFAMRQAINSFNLDTVEGRVGALRAAAPIVSDIRDVSLRPGYTRELARMLGADAREVEAAVRAAGRQSRQSAAPPSASRPEGEPGVGDRDLSAGSRASITTLPRDPVTRLERDAVMAMLQYPTLITSELLAQGVRVSLANASLGVVRDAIAAHLPAEESSAWLADVINDAPGPFQDLVRELAVAPIPERSQAGLGRYVNDVVTSLIERDMLSFKAELVGQLQRLGDSTGEPYRRVQRQLVELEAARRRLRAAQM